jgi:hypothetical protein
MNGKGSAPRPFSVDQATFARHWDAIFSGARLGAEDSSNLSNVGPIPTAPAIYVDDATGA